jgi:hypothetical protein
MSQLFSSITVIQTKKCTQLYYSYNDIIKTTDSYIFWALLAHHQGVQQIV